MQASAVIAEILSTAWTTANEFVKQTAIFERSGGQVCLYEWIENVREKYATVELEAALKNVGDNDSKEAKLDVVQAFESDPQTLRPRVRTAQLVRDLNREAMIAPLIVHGTAIVDRKSTFIAHACPVKCVEDVRSFLALMLDDHKIERAIHNMLAYRIIGECTVKDNDEDGEHGAGSKLSNLLELLKAENVAVMVTRWYGGIKLGPDRFKHINTCARLVLEENGLLNKDDLYHGTRKKKKR